MNATIISIGDEILIGKIVDTNSNWIADRLNKIGIIVNEIIATSDNTESIYNAIKNGFKTSRLLILTGGLGPTSDDKTKEALCSYFNTKLILNKEVLSMIKISQKKRGIKLNKNNHDQALVPEYAKVVKNNLGSAPGIIIEKNDKILIALPGVPFEMKNLIENTILDYLNQIIKPQPIIHKYVLTAGIPEAVLAEKLEKWEKSMPEFINTSYLPVLGLNYLRLSAYKHIDNAESIIKNKIIELNKIIPKNIIAHTDRSIIELLSEALKLNNLTISTAESCTGGKIASKLSSLPGSSKIFVGSIIAYSNKIKENFLGVNSEIICRKGAVSKEVVEQMALGVLNLFKTDYSISTSGIAGPDGGSSEKPVGTVWIAVASKQGVVSEKFFLASERKTNIDFFTNMALLKAYKQVYKNLF